MSTPNTPISRDQSCRFSSHGWTTESTLACDGQKGGKERGAKGWRNIPVLHCIGTASSDGTSWVTTAPVSELLNVHKLITITVETLLQTLTLYCDDVSRVRDEDLRSLYR